MKNLIVTVAIILAQGLIASTWLSDTNSGYSWKVVKSGTNITIGDGSYENGSYRAVKPEPEGELIIPSILGGYTVTGIGKWAFTSCPKITSVTIPESVKTIAPWAFQECISLQHVLIPEGVTSIGSHAFYGCTNLVSLDYPSSIRINGETFAGHPFIQEVVFPDGITQFEVSDCYNLQTLVLPKSIRSYTNRGIENCTNLNKIVFYCNPFKIEEFGNGHCFLPGLPRLLLYPNEIWYSNDVADLWERALRNIGYGGRKVCFCGEWPNASVLKDSWKERAFEVSLTITNVVSHHVIQSVLSNSVIPPLDVGIINIFSEVNAGTPIAIPSNWALQYPEFETKFGCDFTTAVTRPTGKIDSAGNVMFVWQDFVAGTDPTNPNDKFTASITFNKDTNEPIISWTPELSATESAKRRYRKYGKVRLQDQDWTEVADGEESNFNFFKVTVEMR